MIVALYAFLQVVGPGSSAIAVPDRASEDRMAVELAIAAHIRARYSGQVIGYEEVPQEFATPHAPTGPPRADYRSPDHTASLVQVLEANLVTSPSATFCARTLEPQCLDLLVRIGVPAVLGDSATVWVYIYRVAPRATHSEETDREFLLVKSQGGWQFVKDLGLRSAYGRPAPPKKSDP